MTESIPPLEAFLADAEAWLDAHTTRTVTDDDRKLVWGHGEFSVAVFHALSADDERQLLERAKAWTQAKAARGYHAVASPVEDGGLGYPRRYAAAFARLERRFDRPTGHETHSVTTRLIAPTDPAVGHREPAGRAGPPVPRRPRAVLPAVLRAGCRLGPRQPVVPGGRRR